MAMCDGRVGVMGMAMCVGKASAWQNLLAVPGHGAECGRGNMQPPCGWQVRRGIARGQGDCMKKWLTASSQGMCMVGDGLPCRESWAEPAPAATLRLL
jgi:hypothetical protein